MGSSSGERGDGWWVVGREPPEPGGMAAAAAGRGGEGLGFQVIGLYRKREGVGLFVGLDTVAGGLSRPGLSGRAAGVTARGPWSNGPDI
jgi:hypothetical protein